MRLSRVEKGKTAQSRLTVSEEYAQNLINKYAGKGVPYITNSASVANKEFATHHEVIGQYCSVDGQWVDTKRFEIHYGKKDCHIVPVKEK